MQSRVARETPPIGEMNTTPLIDVLLVLLVMFIITIPIQTHAVKLDLPQPCPSCPNPHLVVNTVTVSGTGGIAWNGAPIDKQSLAAMLLRTQQMRPAPELHLRPDPNAPYGSVDEVLGIIKRARVEKFGFVGNEAYAGALAA